MAEHTLFYYPYASLTSAQLPLLKVAALYFDKLDRVENHLDRFRQVTGPFLKTPG